MTKDKKYIEYLLRNYKKNKARLRILELGIVNEQDNIINGIDYSAIKVDTSNLSTLDNSIIAREREMNELIYKINLVDALLDSLDSRKDSQYRKLIENYYINNMTKNEVMHILGLYDDTNFFRLCRIVINSLLELL